MSDNVSLRIEKSQSGSNMVNMVAGRCYLLRLVLISVKMNDIFG